MAGGIKAWNGQTALGGEDLGLSLFSGRETPMDILSVAYSLEQGLEATIAWFRDNWDLIHSAARFGPGMSSAVRQVVSRG